MEGTDDIPSGTMLPPPSDPLLARQKLTPAALAKTSVRALAKMFRWSVKTVLGQDPVRYAVLFVFCLVSFSNSVISLSFSSFPDESKHYYPGLTDMHLTLLLLWCAVIPVVGMFPAMWLLTMDAGLRYCIQLGALFVALGSVVRFLPSLVSREVRQEHQLVVLVLLHAGQIINAMAFPLFMASPSQLSSTWFPANHRTTVTAIGAIFCEIGFAFAFFIPAMSTDIENVLLQELNLGLVAGITAVSMSFFPAKPNQQQPSLSALVHDTLIAAVHEEEKTALAELREEAIAAFSIPSFVILALFVGASGGVWTGWCPMIPEATMPMLTEEEADQLSLLANLSTIIGGLAIGPIADIWFDGRYKQLLMLLFVGAFFSFSWFTVAMPTPLKLLNRSPLLSYLRSEGFGLLNVPVVLSGLFQGAMVPVTYELCAEICFPLSDGTSAGIYQLMVNLGQMTFLFIPVLCSTEWFNLFCLISIVVGFLGLCFVSPTYRRKQLRDHLAGKGSALTPGSLTPERTLASLLTRVKPRGAGLYGTLNGATVGAAPIYMHAQKSK